MARIAIGAGVAIVALIVLAQLLAAGDRGEQWCAGRSRGMGRVKSVTVKAWPAVKLLWGDADEVRVQRGSAEAEPEQAAVLLREAKGHGERGGERGKRGRGRAEADGREARKARERAAGGGAGEREKTSSGRCRKGSRWRW